MSCSSIRLSICLVLVVVLASCSAPSPSSSTPSQSGGQTVPSGPKRLTIAVHVDTQTTRDFRGRPFPDLMVGSFTLGDRAGGRVAQLAEAVPTIDNGLWKVFPDGRMETTWRIREGARWHDGQPLTADDVLFTAQVLQDREMPQLHDAAFDLIDRVEASDPRTITIFWKSPSIDADAMFGTRGFLYGSPLPKHVLQQPYLESKATFEDHPYWTTEFMGSGPFRLREWVKTTYSTMDAFPDYVLGRPKLDQIEVKFILDPSVIVANVLAGSVGLTADRAVSVEQGVTVRDIWKEGQIQPYVSGWMMLYPQLRAPNPAILLEPQFRKALVYSVDRRELADTLAGGYGPVAESIIPPDQVEYPFVEKSIVHYDFDPRRAAQILDGLGLTPGPDGIRRDSSGQRITIQIRASSLDSNQKSMITVADGFNRVGVGTEPTTIRAATGTEEEYSYPGFRLASQDNGVVGIVDLLHSRSAPLPERNWRAPNSPKNRGSYVNADYDAIMDRYKVTIPMPERMQVLADLVHWQTDLVLVFGLFHTANTVMIANRLQNVAPASVWNAHNWDAIN